MGNFRDIVEFKCDIAFTLGEQSENRVSATMPVGPGMVNPFGTVHAGAMIWFADIVATRLARVALATSGELNTFPLAINIQAAVLSNQRDGDLVAEARFVRKGKRVSVIRTAVTGTGGKLLLDLTTTHVPSGAAEVGRGP